MPVDGNILVFVTGGLLYIHVGKINVFHEILFSYLIVSRPDQTPDVYDIDKIQRRRERLIYSPRKWTGTTVL